jgi:hypothetical protein
MDTEQHRFKVGDIIRHKRDFDTALITFVHMTGTLYGHTTFGGEKDFPVGSSEEITTDCYEDWELAEESIVDKVLTKYKNEDNRNTR